MTAEPKNWEGTYAAGVAPWDIGRAQSAFVRLAEEGLLVGRVLDAGCGTGEHALLAAAEGAEAVGVDISPGAIARARAKAAEQGLKARFEIADALNLAQLGLVFDTVIDSGLFHNLDDEGWARYVTSLASVLRSGGNCYLLCFSEHHPQVLRPRRVRKDQIVSAFGSGWSIISITPDKFEFVRGSVPGTAQAWLATIRRL